MNEQQTSAIFGLNFLQDMKGERNVITGAYDPEQELWISQGPVGMFSPGYTGPTTAATLNGTYLDKNPDWIP